MYRGFILICFYLYITVGYDRLQYDKLREAQVEGIDQNRNNPPRRGIG